MMKMIMSILFPVTDSLQPVLYDVAVWPIIVVGLAMILGIGAVIVIVIIAAVKFLKRLRNNKAKNV